MNEIEQRLRLALPEIARRLRNELVVTAPVDTGRLANSIKVEVTSKGLKIFMAEYGKYVEFGTPPHTIKPSGKKALKFEVGRKQRLESKGRNKNIVFAKEVKHPGTRPNPFIRNALRNKLGRIVAEELSKVRL